ncbi:MAG: formate-dependent phosphoribosylglycinamide formyltransferase [Methylococcaceae bacterium]|nr:MAG: formate-dependent phosphoribosylglycinamide formyltransferase [Methylococcaceae bacterium]
MSNTLPRYIGTPLSPTATRVMLLGSGELGKEVAICLQRYGVEVIAVDRYAHAPAQQVAHRSHVIDMNDGSALRELVLRERPDYIVPELEAIATGALAQIEDENLAQVIPTARAVQLTMHREGIRRLAAEELKLPTSRYAFAGSLTELSAAIEEHIGYPCFIKPVMSSSGKGQSMVRQADEIPVAWEHACSGGRVDTTRVIVEGKIDFDFEITLLTVRALDEQGRLTTYFCEPIGHRQQDGDYVESWQPQSMSHLALERAQAIAATVTTALGGRGLFGVELFVQGDTVWFSEVSPRPHDTGMVTMISQRQNEFELHTRAILGLPVNTGLLSPGASAVIYGQCDATGIAYGNMAQALLVPNSEIRLFGKPVSFVKRRMGVALAADEDLDVARQNAREAATQVRPIAV